MTKINPYLNFDGKCEEAFNFYKSVFGGEFLGGVYKLGVNPSMPVPEEAKNRVMHVGLPIGNDLLMGSDTMPGSVYVEGNNNHISIFPDSKEEADRLFAALSVGGQVFVPLADQFWGDYFGNLKDQFGVFWMINYNAQNQ